MREKLCCLLSTVCIMGSMQISALANTTQVIKLTMPANVATAMSESDNIRLSQNGQEVNASVPTIKEMPDEISQFIKDNPDVNITITDKDIPELSSEILKSSKHVHSYVYIGLGSVTIDGKVYPADYYQCSCGDLWVQY